MNLSVNSENITTVYDDFDSIEKLVDDLLNNGLANANSENCGDFTIYADLFDEELYRCGGGIINKNYIDVLKPVIKITSDGNFLNEYLTDGTIKLIFNELELIRFAISNVENNCKKIECWVNKKYQFDDELDEFDKFDKSFRYKKIKYYSMITKDNFFDISKPVKNIIHLCQYSYNNETIIYDGSVKNNNWIHYYDGFGKLYDNNGTLIYTGIFKKGFILNKNKTFGIKYQWFTNRIEYYGHVQII